MRIIPNNYEEIEGAFRPTSLELSLIKSFENNLLEDHCLILLKISPASGIRADLCLIHREIGIFFIFTRENLTTEANIAVNTNSMVSNIQIGEILNRFKTHRQLIDKKGNIKIPIGFLYFFSDIKRGSINKTTFATNHCIFKDDQLNSKINLIGILQKSLVNRHSKFVEINENDLNALHYAIVPEYRLPKFNISKEYKNFEDQDFNTNEIIEISLSSRDITKFKALSLTNNQINLVNTIKYGPELILAGAGTGKTVILAARAFRMAKLFDDKNILLTCYNKSLSEYMDLYLDTAGMKSRNLTCKTFHAFCRYLLESNYISLPRRTSTYDEYFQKLFETTYYHIKMGNIKQHYFAIFIDEVQDFENEWLQLLYLLLEDKRKFVLNICGDKTQDVRRIMVEKGEPWISNSLPKFEENKNYFKTNYRCSSAIYQYVRIFNKIAKGYLSQIDSSLYEDKDLFIENTKNIKKGKSNIPNVTIVQSYGEEIDEVIENIKELHEKYNVAFSDIGIVFPRKQTRKYNHTYNPYYFLMKALEENNIPNTSLLEREETFEGFHNRNGVVISTINSAKGLDFRALILFGTSALYPNKLSESMDQESKIRLISNINLLYTAITRAEDYLRIVMLEREEKNLYGCLLIDPIKKILKIKKQRRKNHVNSKG